MNSSQSKIRHESLSIIKYSEQLAQWLRLWILNVNVPDSNVGKFFFITLATNALISLLPLHNCLLDFYQTAKDFEVQCLGYSCTNF